MQNKTHLAIGAFFMLFFMSKVVYLEIYIAVFVVATLMPNVDRFLSLKGLISKGSNPQRKRGIFHTFTFCLIVTAILSWFFPIAAFPFFLGYGTHLIADSWTVEGIRPFWPLKAVSKGSVKNGGSLEQMLFYGFIIADVILAYILLF